MRIFSALIPIVVLGLGFGAEASGQQTCSTGLCLQQVSCPNGGTTSISGVVYAPNGTDPLPNVTVYIPNAPVTPFTPGVTCDVVGAAPSGSPIVGATTAVDGSFTLGDVPVGSNIPLVIVSGRWRRQLTVPSTAACTNTALPSAPSAFAVMPQNHTQGDIPLFAIASGGEDQVECVLLKVGVAQSEFTDPGGGGRINLFGGGGAAGSGVTLDASTPTQASLMGGNGSTLNNYDVLMLPCEGAAYIKPAQELANLITFANDGGRVYSSHFSYDWMYQNPPFNGVASWVGSTTDVTPDPGVATVDQSFTAGQTLATWLQNVGATTTLGQMPISTLRKDTNGVVAPTQSWLALNNTNYNNPIMQFVFNTPIAPTGTTVNQCGRVLYNEYHVENPTGATTGKIFPNECSSAAMTPQEKLLEYSLFELTGEGGQPTLAPTTQDFGSEAIGFPTGPQIFTWTNNSSFPSSVTSATITGDFSISSNNCAAVAPGTSCQIKVVFTPTLLGARAGMLTVVSSGNTLTATLTGTGVPGFTISPAALTFGNVDVGASVAQSLTLTNIAPQALPLPPFVTTGPYAVSTAGCKNPLPALATCPVSVTFLPVTTGPLAGTVGVNSSSLLYSGLSATLTGTGVDFSLSLNPTSGTVVAGDGATSTATLTPIAGFASPVTLSCTIVAGAVASTCGLGTTSITPTTTATAVVSISTTSQFTVVGYGGFGGHGYLWLIAVCSGCLLFAKRRSAGTLVRGGLLLVFLAAMSLSATGCSGKTPAKNAAFTGPGNYVVTVSGTDGFLVHSATYSLTVK